jgi:hypothetical protein
VGIGWKYPEYAQRLKKSCENYGIDHFIWINEYPPGARPHQESPYGFKIHALKYAIEQGYTNIIWCDSPAHIIRDPQPLFDTIKERGYYFVRDIYPLDVFVDNASLQRFGRDREWAKKVYLGCGTLFGLNIKHDIGKKCFDFYLNWEIKNWYDSKRHDEPLMTYLVDEFDLIYSETGEFFQTKDQPVIISGGW